jgi:hypothetical protein
MEEPTISTLGELLVCIKKYVDKGFYFRGEHTKFETACLPKALRDYQSYSSDDIYIAWLTSVLEALGTGAPYYHLNDESTIGRIKEALLNAQDSLRKWDEKKLKALLDHYSLDFAALNKVVSWPYSNQEHIHFKSSYLNITSDIMVALHFTCSEFKFQTKDEAGKCFKQQAPEYENGCLFVFDLHNIDNSQYLKFVSHSSYSYFYKKEEEFFYQPFDRITHQRGAFLAPKEGMPCQEIFEKELDALLLEKIILTDRVKKELFHLFGDTKGMDYYFPKIPCGYSPNCEAQRAYADLEGITLLK